MSNIAVALKVLLVSPLPPPRGGIATWTELIAAESHKRADLTVRVVDTAPRWRAEHQLEVWRRVIGGGIQLVRDVLYVVLAIARFRPDTVHLCTAAQLGLMRDIALLSLSKFFGLRTVYHLHFGRLSELALHRNREWQLIAWAIRLADTVAVLDFKTLATIQAEFPACSCTWLPNCTKTPEIGAKSRLFVIAAQFRLLPRVVYVGWVIPTKGLLELIAAAKTVVDDSPFELEIVGAGHPDFVATVQEMGTSLGRLLLLRGELSHDDAIAAIERADLLVLPSHTEGFPYVVLEAMSLGKPVIGTDVGAIREMLSGKNGDCGIVVPPKNVTALADALRRLIDDPELRQQMGKNAQTRFAENYECSQVIKTLIQIWSA